MAVQNRILKVQKRNRALVRFDESRIQRAILRASESIGGFREDFLPDINGAIFDACQKEERIAEFISDGVVVCLNSESQHLIANFPPTIETIQDQVVHVLRSHGFQNTADAYECYRWGRHWLREGAIPVEKFAGNGISKARVESSLAWNKARGCDTVTGLNELVRSARITPVIEESVSDYEQSLDKATRGILSRMPGSPRLRVIWVSGPSSSGKTSTTVKLTERLEKAGVRIVTLSLDDYFWPVVEHPTDWINDRNYETPEAIDIQLVNEHLRGLLEGRAVEKPVYNFKEGRRVATKTVRLEPDQVLLLDCLHGLYPRLATASMPPLSSGFTWIPRTTVTRATGVRGDWFGPETSGC